MFMKEEPLTEGDEATREEEPEEEEVQHFEDVEQLEEVLQQEDEEEDAVNPTECCAIIGVQGRCKSFIRTLTRIALSGLSPTLARHQKRLVRVPRNLSPGKRA